MTAGLGAVAAPAEAQYFGRNKVQYESFDFEVMKTDHFDIYYYPEEKPAVEIAALMAERWYARLSRLLNHDLTTRQPLILYASGAHFRQTNVLQGEIGEATGGVTEILKRRMVLPFAGPLKETDHVLGHELVHAFQFDMTGEGGGVLIEGIPSVMRMPLWFVEGMAEYLSIGPVDANSAMWMRDAARTELPDVRKLGDPRFFPYRYGHALWSYIAGRWGDDAVGRILKASRASAGNLGRAFRRVLRMPLDTVVAKWHQATRDYYLPLMELTATLGTLEGSGETAALEPPKGVRALISPQKGGGHYNIAPSLSPDGKWLVFLSERDLFSIDMFLADAETGKIRRKILETAVNPHFESIQFISSAGAWDHEGRRFAFSGLQKGRPVLSILDIERDAVSHEIDLPELGEVYSPTWSPDGRRIAFSGLTGGLSDIYVYDLETEQLERLTHDAYADLQPAWSPDGRYIAFVTDRFTTGLASLLYGDYRIGLLDYSSRAVSEAPGFDSGKHINPQWSPDGGSLYFVSDRNGISNVYRAEMAGGELYQVTNLYTGVSGITGLSPSMTVAAASGRIAMSVYEADDYVIYTIDSTEAQLGGSLEPSFEINAAALPPTNRLSDDLVALLDNAFYGLPRDTAYATQGYRPKLGLDYISQPSLAFGADRFGTFIGGGVSLFWSDVLGGHNLATGLSVNGSFKDISVLLGYANLNRRLNWSVSAQQIPYRTGFIQRQQVLIDGAPYLREDFILYRQINRQIGGAVAYPLSGVQRVEFSGGYLGVSFDLERETRIYAPDGTPVFRDKTNDNVADPLHLGQATAALVYDNSLFGVTSPMLGQRYRFELGTNVGSLDYHTALLDYRKYVMPIRPFTLAGRIMHYGRYGPDGDNQDILSPVFLGYDGLVRGYDFSSIDVLRECPRNSLTCPVFEQLYGSKIAVANAELRFPLLGVLGIGSGLFGFLPLEMVVFGDAGLAWWDRELPPEILALPSDEQQQFVDLLETEKPFFLGGTREPVFSAGTGLRMNLFGMAIITLNYAYPFNRPNKGGHLQFTFTPGF